MPRTFGARNDGGDWKRIATRLTVLAKTKRRVILSAEHERIRNPLKRKNGLPRTFGARNDGGDWKRIVTRLTSLAKTKRCVILSAEHERIRNPQ